jgi:hypothetical protein
MYILTFTKSLKTTLKLNILDGGIEIHKIITTVDGDDTAFIY